MARVIFVVSCRDARASVVRSLLTISSSASVGVSLGT